MCFLGQSVFPPAIDENSCFVVFWPPLTLLFKSSLAVSKCGKVVSPWYFNLHYFGAYCGLILSSIYWLFGFLFFLATPRACRSSPAWDQTYGPKPLQWQCQILNPLSHKGTPLFGFLTMSCSYLLPVFWRVVFFLPICKSPLCVNDFIRICKCVAIICPVFCLSFAFNFASLFR